MSSQRRVSSTSTSQHYNLRSSTSHSMGNSSARELLNDGEAGRVTDYFVVRKRPSASSDSGENDSNKRVRNVNSDQVVPQSQARARGTLLRPRPSADLLRRLPANPYGTFATFSNGALFTFIEQAPVIVLAGLGSSSHCFNNLLKQYAMSGSARKRLAMEVGNGTVDTNNAMTRNDPFFAWGKLLKAVTISETATERVKCFSLFHAKNYSAGSRAGWGRCMLSFVERWDFNECYRLMSSLFATAESGLFNEMCEVLNESAGVHPQKEMKVRRGIRELLLDHKYMDVRDSPFWLSAVLRTRSSFNNWSKLVYLLYGQTKINQFQQEVIDWHAQSETPVTTIENSELRLGELSKAFSTLLMTSTIGLPRFTYSEAEVFNIIEEVTTYPEPWSFDNFVAILLNRPMLIPLAMVYRVHHGYSQEAGQIYTVMKSLLFRWNLSAYTFLMQPMQIALQKLTHYHRSTLIRAIIQSEHSAHMEVFGLLPGGFDEYVTEVRASAAATPLLIHLVLLR